MSQWDPGNRSVFFFFLSLKCFPSNFLLFLFSFFFLYLSQKGFSLFFFVILQPLSQQLSIVYSIYTWNALSPGRTIERKGLCVWSRLPSGSFLGGDHPLYASGTVTPERKGGNLFILFKVEQVWNFSSLSPSSYFNHFVRCLVCRRAYSNFSL